MESLWETMKKMAFVSCQPVNHELTCLICKSIVINAHSGPCGCLYCFECIVTYLSKGTRFCPGNTEECQVKTLNINEDIVVDRSSNVSVSKLVVKCPNKNCSFKDELRQIENHLRICTMKCEKCPYFEIGCKESEISTEELSGHILQEIVNHSKLLLESIDNLRNEVESLKRTVENLQVEKKQLIEEVELVMIDKIVKEMVREQLKQAMDEKVGGFNENTQISKKEDFVLYKCEKKLINANETSNEATNRVKGKSNSEQPMKDKSSNEVTGAQCEGFSKFTDKSTKSLVIDVQNLQSQILKIESNLEKENYGEFLWILENWWEKFHQAELGIQSSFFSDAFFTHKYGYKLCLRIYPVGIGEGKGSHLSVFFHVMSGQFDNTLPWPCKLDITFKMSDQESGYDHVVQSCSYENKPNSSSYRKPTSDKNIGIGIPKFIEIKELFSNNNLSNDNKLFIRCSVNINS